MTSEVPTPERLASFERWATASLASSALLVLLLAGFWLGRISGLGSGGEAYGFRATAFAAVATACCVSHGWASGGARFVGRFLAIGLATSLSTELAGVATGSIFGPYAYSAGFPAKILGLVPVVIPFIWFSISYWSFATAQAITGALPAAGVLPKLVRTLLAAALLLGYDLTADPNHVFRGGWSYDGPDFFYGVPLQNFIAWFVIGSVMFALVGRFAYPHGAQLVHSALHDRVAPLVYVALLLHESAFALLVSKLPGAGWLGLGVATAVLVALVSAWWRGAAEHRDRVVSAPTASY